MTTLALVAGLHCTADADKWSLFAFVSAEGNLQAAGNDYAHSLMTVAAEADLTVALQIDNGTDRPVRHLLFDGRVRSIGESQAPEPSSHHGEFADFFRWARDSTNADRYAVVVFGHGVSASGRGWDGARAGSWPMLGLTSRADGAPLRPAALATAMREGLGRSADVLVLDTCYGASLEAVWDLRRAADVIVASPGRVPSTGMPWERALLEAPGTASAADTGRRWAGAGEGAVAVDTRGLVSVAKSIAALSTALLEDIDEFAPALTAARSSSDAWGWQNEMCNLRELCDVLAQHCGDGVSEAALDAVAALDDCIVSDGGALTVPFPAGLWAEGVVSQPEGFNEISRWGEMTAAYLDRQQQLMRRTLDDLRPDGEAT